MNGSDIRLLFSFICFAGTSLERDISARIVTDDCLFIVASHAKIFETQKRRGYMGARSIEPALRRRMEATLRRPASSTAGLGPPERSGAAAQQSPGGTEGLLEAMYGTNVLSASG